MSTEFEKLKDDLLALPPQSRASLAHALIASLDEEFDEDVEKLWEEEVRRRHQEIKNGSVVLKSADEVLRTRATSMFEVNVHADADNELNASAVFYESKEPGLGEAFLQELATAFQLLREFPLSCQL